MAKLFRFSFLIIPLVVFYGCVFAPNKFGPRGCVTPGSEQYSAYLLNCRKMSPVLDARCREWGDPAVIKIGSSGGYFVWRSPRKLIQVGSFGNTVERVRIPGDMLPYIGESSARAVKRDYRQSVNDSPAATSSANAHGYAVKQFERLPGNDFAYVFKIAFKDDSSVGIADGQRIKRELRSSIEEDYLSAYPDAKGESVQIDFPVFSMKDGVVEGRAEITRIAVTSFKYDDVTQKGSISVRIGSASFDKARQWVRKNIETIVRDKNIALTTGQVPSDKRFFIGSEHVLPGNVLEIGFEAE